MAKPINNTPVLTGQDAVNFYSNIERNKNKKVDRASILSIREAAKQLQSILKPR